MRRKRLAVLVAVLVVVAGALYGSGMMGASAEADSSDEQEFRWMVGVGVVDFPAPGGLLCAFGCPVFATAANDDTIEIAGEGTLAIDADDGEPEDVDGGGTFTHNFAAGGSASGTWEAKQLLMFDAYGPGPGLPADWRAGRALILVRLVAGDMEADAILEIGCRLNAPGLPGGGIPGTIEGIRLLISGGQNFNMEEDPRATLFIDITDEDDDEDDDDDDDD